MWWRDLSDSELRARLEQRGLAADAADVLVRHRAKDYCAEALDELFDRG